MMIPTDVTTLNSHDAISKAAIQSALLEGAISDSFLLDPGNLAHYFRHFSFKLSLRAPEKEKLILSNKINSFHVLVHC